MNLIRINVYLDNNRWADYPDTRHETTLPNLMAMKRYGPYRVDIGEDVEERVYYLSILHALLENCKQELLAFKQFGRGGIQILIEDKIKPATTMYIPHGVYGEDDGLLHIPHALSSLYSGVILLANTEQDDNQRPTASSSSSVTYREHTIPNLSYPS
ncbi:uncharacterized protein BO96DRAFT_483265 [Aspergillus niger CBS 101883]|uniref:uncharacterized protein n=1 Tax=Aspergillus lacticoffeatus (strain CBS 101883) TaxID=1450533 RepID=UPI000D7FE7C4|nr:uncharacterized protein BO96DRAFT_483265 [Aspergillus niger CBS 101883]PYH60419.1 hypothetical protein BO96DRAFT_483265 [Aspergillus niger CBS 101883]